MVFVQSWSLKGGVNPLKPSNLSTFHSSPFHHSIPAHSTESRRPFKVMCECQNRDPCGRLDSVEWNGGMEWTVNMLDNSDWFHLLIMTTSEQRPPVNKDHPNLMTE